jgi:hypothetical protein
LRAARGNFLAVGNTGLANLINTKLRGAWMLTAVCAGLGIRYARAADGGARFGVGWTLAQTIAHNQIRVAAVGAWDLPAFAAQPAYPADHAHRIVAIGAAWRLEFFAAALPADTVDRDCPGIAA